MSNFLPLSDGLMRSTLRESIKRLKRIRVKGGKEDEDGEGGEKSGDPFRDITNQFLRGVKKVKELINDRDLGMKKNGRDRIAIEESNEIRKELRQLEEILVEMKKLVDQAEGYVVRENKRKKPRAKKLILLEGQLKERDTQYKECVQTHTLLRDLDAQRVAAGGKRGINTTQEMQLGKKAQLREQLLNMKRVKHVDPNGGPATGGGFEYVDTSTGGGRLEDNEETKEQMKVLASQEAEINAGLDRISKGVSRLHNLALEIGGQIDMQNQMLDKTEETMDKQTKQLRSINARIGKLMRDTKPMNLFINICCIVLILALVGFFLFQFNVI